MIFQLQQYLEAYFPTESIFSNLAIKVDSAVILPDRLVIISEGPGTTQPRTGYTNKGLHVFTRDIDPVKARKLAYDIFGYLNDTYSLSLSAITVDGDVYPAMDILQISANGDPQSIGFDDEGRAEWTTNYRVIFRRL